MDQQTGRQLGLPLDCAGVGVGAGVGMEGWVDAKCGLLHLLVSMALHHSQRLGYHLGSWNGG